GGWKGVLTFRNEEKEIDLRVEEGKVNVHAISGERAVRLGELLVRQERISTVQLDQALEKQAVDRRRIGDILVEMGALSSTDRDRALHAQVEEELFDLFAWSGGEYDYVSAPPPGDAYSSQVFEAEALVERSIERLKEWRELTQEILDDREIFTLTPEGKAAIDSLDPLLEREVAVLLTGENDVADVTGRLLVPRYRVYRVLGSLLRRGLIRRPTVEELWNAGLFMRDQRRLKLATKLLERAFDLSPRNPALLEALAEMFEAAGDGKRAAAFLKLRAEMAYEAGEPARGIALCEKIAALHPIDAYAFEHLFERALASGDAERLSELGRTLMRIYHAEKNREKAIATGLRVLERVPGDLVLRQKLVNLYLETGDKASAVRQFEAMEDLVRRDPARTPGERDRDLLPIYDKILRLDPGRAETRAKLDALRKTAEPEETKIIRRRSRARLLRWAAAAVALLLLAASAAVLYRWQASRAYPDCVAEASELEQQGRLAEAANRFGDFASGHPWSRAGEDASRRHLELLDRIAEVERKAAEEEDRALARVREGRGLFAGGDAEGALAVFREVERRKAKDRATEEARFARIEAETALERGRQETLARLHGEFRAMLDTTDPAELGMTPEAHERALEAVRKTFDLVEAMEALWPGGGPTQIADDRKQAAARRVDLLRRLQRLYAELGQAEWNRREGYLPDARAYLEKAARINGDPAVLKAVEALLKEVEAYAATAEGLEKAIEEAVQTAPSLKPEERAKVLEKAVQDVRDLASKFPRAVQSRDALLPLFLETSPPGARIVCDRGRPTEQRTPAVLWIPLTGRTVVGLEKRGYAPVDFTAEPGVVAREFALTKTPLWSLRVGGAVEGGLGGGEGLVFAAGR
ncbi:MAG: hypothetical protein MUC63_09965, partial [Planctomycetes bacterium]|nr:hypothetical protein [Planctomycetota bacterium]